MKEGLFCHGEFNDQGEYVVYIVIGFKENGQIKSIQSTLNADSFKMLDKEITNYKKLNSKWKILKTSLK